MLVLFETPAGFAIFKLLKEQKLEQCENLFNEFENPDKAHKILKLKHFHKFEDTTEALAAATSAVEGKVGKSLKKVLKNVVSKEVQESLAVADAKLGNCIKEKFDIQCVSGSGVQELMRCIRFQMDSLIEGLSKKELGSMSLGLAHSLSRYKLKFSPDKVDIMIVQAISLLDDLDKELNNYMMRAKEWYGWHFPELSKIITDNITYAKIVLHMGDRKNCPTTDFADILTEELEAELKTSAEISMGTEVAEEDIENVKSLCEQVVEINDYRAQLYEYLKNRMMAIAPNLCILVGELVGARLIAHAGSLMNLAKQPASTVQILGAEKALFRALKTKHNTPKYGLIYHATLIGQTAPKHKAKLARMLAAKAALAIRVDALGEDVTHELGIEHRAKLDERIKFLEDGQTRKISGLGKSLAKNEKYIKKNDSKVFDNSMSCKIPLKRKFEAPPSEEINHEKKKTKKEIKNEEPEIQIKSDKTPKSEKKKKKKDKKSDMTSSDETPKSEKKKKKKHIKNEIESSDDTPKRKKVKKEVEVDDEDIDTPKSKKKKKKMDAEIKTPKSDKKTSKKETPKIKKEITYEEDSSSSSSDSD